MQDKTVRGQYGAGHIGGQEVPAYYFEKDVDNDSDTETFVAVHAHIDNWRWAGVPFYLRTGKRMARRSSQIVIQFKPVPHELFNGGQVNQLLIQLQPEERISLRMMTKSPGKGMRLAPVELDLNLAQVFGQTRRWEATSVCCWTCSKGTRRCSCDVTKWKPPGPGSTRSSRAGRNTSSLLATTLPEATGQSRPTACWPGMATSGTEAQPATGRHERPDERQHIR